MALFNSRTVKIFGRSVNFLVSQSGSTRTDYVSISSRLVDIRHFSDKDTDDGSENAKRKSSSATTTTRPRDSEISSSMTLLQDGLHIQELPVLVKKTSEIPGWTEFDEDNVKALDVDSQSSSNTENEELNKVIQLHLRQVTTVNEVLQYLLVIPQKDVTPLVALSILERIIELQNDATDEGQTRKPPAMETSTIMMLCNIVCKSGTSSLILSGLETVIKIWFHSPEDVKKKYIDVFVKECLQRVHGGNLSLMHICWLIENLFNAGNSFQDISDSVWSEIVARESEITVENINRVFAMLLYLKTSRKIVLSMLERCIEGMYQKLHQRQVIHMLHILCLLKLHSTKLLGIFSCWSRINVHRLTESGLRDIIMLMNSIQYTNSDLETATERFMKVRGTMCKDTLLMTALATKLRQFRWRNPVVLESISGFFVQNVNKLSADTWASLIQVFGHLNYEPSNSYQLFQSLESALSDKIPDLDPDTVISILLSCVYIQRYPLNFVKKLFSPGFLDRLNFQAGSDEIRRQRTYNNLKLLDTALHLECPMYAGPYLPRNLTAKSLVRDSRIVRLQKKLSSPLGKLVGGHNFFNTSVVLPKLPLNHLYIVDIMINLDKNGKPQPYLLGSGVHKKIAVLLLLPEYYCRMEPRILIGPQAMRLRHLNLMGLSVVTLDVFGLEQMNPKELTEHLETTLCPAFTK